MKENIQAPLTHAIQGSGLILQVKQTGDQLVVVMNCPKQKADAQFQENASKLLEKLTSLDLPTITSAKFYGRREGNPKPEWQQTHKLSALSTQTQEEPQMAVKTLVTKKQGTSSPQNILKNLPELQVSGLLVPALLAGILGVQLLTGLATLFSKPAPVQWEYRVEAVPDITFTETMDLYGSDGWELVTARRAQDSVTDEFSYECIFKRLLTEEN